MAQVRDWEGLENLGACGILSFKDNSRLTDNGTINFALDGAYHLFSVIEKW